jgi:signal transduction histidine kinase
MISADKEFFSRPFHSLFIALIRRYQCQSLQVCFPHLNQIAFLTKIRMNLLFIENHPERLTRIHALFEQAKDVVLQVAPSLESADALIRQRPFDVVFIGKDAIARDRLDESIETFSGNNPDIPLILSMEKHDEETVRSALRLGFEDCVSAEPFAVERWLETAARAVARRAGRHKTLPPGEAWLKEQLYRVHRLALTGMLVPGIAHDLNNPLTGTIAYTELLSEKTTDPGLRADLNKILDSADRCKKIVDNVLTFSRQKEQVKSLELVGNILDRAVDLRGYSFRLRNIEIVKNYGKTPSVFVKLQDLQLVALNILMNAEQAIEEGGTGGGRITLTTGYNSDRQAVSLRIADSGPGIAPRLLPRIFAPFFTTKSSGVGSGLGLPLSRAIIADHGGTLRAENGEGGGAVFIIELPTKN